MMVTQELKDEEKRWAELWAGRRRVADRKQIDRQREGGGSPVRNQKPKSTFLDDIDDPRGDYARAGAEGYDRGPQYPYTMADVRRHDAEVKGLLDEYTHPERASSISAPRQESSSSSPPKETSGKVQKCGHGVKTKPPRKSNKRKSQDDTDEMTAPMDSSSSMAARKRRAESLVPKFEVGEKVKFASEDGKEWLYGTISQWILPGDPRNTLDHPHVVVMYLIDQVGGRQAQIEEDLIDHTIYGQENPRFRMHPEGKSNKTTLVVKVSLSNSLHDLDLVGIDTCSAVSVSTEKEDFIFVDGSREARDSVTLRGVGGSSSVIGGRGPMVVKTKDKEGNEVLMFDPSAVYLDPDELDDSQFAGSIPDIRTGQTKKGGVKDHSRQVRRR